MKWARGVVADLPGSTRRTPNSGSWHSILANGENLRVHQPVIKYVEAADAAEVGA